MTEDTTPILIGAGQLTGQRGAPVDPALDPVAMMAEAARRAASDAGGGDRLLAQIDTLAVVSIIAWRYQNAPRLLAECLGAHPARELYTTVGGNTPQWLVNHTAERIAAGEIRLALLAGAEAVHTLLRARRSGAVLAWTSGGEGSPAIVGDPRAGTSECEEEHGLQMPTQIYPIFENALRARHGWTLAQHRERLGRLCSGLSAVAAENPYAWFRQARTSLEITTVTPQNRMIGFPYPKLMNAIIDVDQAAAVLMTSAAAARQLGIDRSRWVYLCGAADAYDHWLVSDRVDYASSPAIRAAGLLALERAGLAIAEIDHFDLYSCFPCAVEIAREALGIGEDDVRPASVTGGLAYAGGPGNNYSMHAIATMMERLRRAPGAKGLVSALGWYLTKHSIGVYASAPHAGAKAPDAPADVFAADADRALQAELDRMPHPSLAREATGRGTIETYTVLHDRDGAPARGIVIGRLEDGRRFIANTPNDRSLLESLMTQEPIGLLGTACHAGGINSFSPL